MFTRRLPVEKKLLIQFFGKSALPNAGPQYFFDDWFG